jgi:hypothetical protein
MARKRKPGKRTASGQLSRAADTHQEHIDPIMTRMRLFGLNAADARDQKASTVIGRMLLTGELGKLPHSEIMYNAAVSYLSTKEAFQRAVKSPDALRSGDAGGSGDTFEGEEYDRRCKSAIEKWEAVKRAVQDENNLHRYANMYAALDYIVCRNEDHPHMYGDCRLGLNAVAHHFGMMGKREKVAA